MEDEQPLGVPGTDGTATVDGPAVDGPVGGTLGLVSDPPGAGSPTGWACVEVQVDRGSFVLLHPQVEIFVRSASSGAVLASVTWPGDTVSSDPTIWRLGPIDVDPWEPLTVAIEERSPTVDGWSARIAC